MDADTLLLAVVVVTALAFDFTNGFHDTANAMATSIATGALRPRVAVAVSAVLNFVGAFLSLSVAATIAKDIVDAGAIDLHVVLAALVGAILWNLATWYAGIPSSSSHALVGGVVGATLAAVGPDAVKGRGVVSDVLAPAVIAPLVAALVAALACWAAHRVTRAVDPALRARGFRAGQIGSASLVSLAHGTNDAQKTMGIITLALLAHGSLGRGEPTPGWVVFACAAAMAVGTYLGGWRIIRTLGKGLTEITPTQGFAAEGSSASVILAASHVGFPLSTTHVVSGSVLGSGLARREAEVRWSVAARMAVAWLVTLPAAGAVGAAAWFFGDLVGGTAGTLAVTALLVAASVAFYAASRRAPVGAHNVNDSWQPEAAPADGPAPARV